MAAEMRVTEAVVEAGLRASYRIVWDHEGMEFSEDEFLRARNEQDMKNRKVAARMMRAALEAALGEMLEPVGRIKGVHGADDFCCTREIGFIPMKDQAVFVIKESKLQPPPPRMIRPCSSGLSAMSAATSSRPATKTMTFAPSARWTNNYSGRWTVTADNPTKNESLPELRKLPEYWRQQMREAGMYPQLPCTFADELDAALTREAPPEAVNVGDWLWDALTDWCKKQRISPYTQDALFAIVKDARKQFPATPPAPQRMAQGDSWFADALASVGEVIPMDTQPPHQDRGEVERWARELLADTCDESGCPLWADALRNNEPQYRPRAFDVALRAIVAALTEAKQQGPGEADEHLRDAWTDFECEYLTDGNGYAPNTTYKACSDAFKAAWPDREAAYAAAVDAYEKCHGTRKSLTQHYAELYRREGTAPQVEAKRQTGERVDHG